MIEEYLEEKYDRGYLTSGLGNSISRATHELRVLPQMLKAAL
jgi:hypothetical protein